MDEETYTLTLTRAQAEALRSLVGKCANRRNTLNPLSSGFGGVYDMLTEALYGTMYDYFEPEYEIGVSSGSSEQPGGLPLDNHVEPLDECALILVKKEA